MDVIVNSRAANIHAYFARIYGYKLTLFTRFGVINFDHVCPTNLLNELNTYP